MNPRVHRSRVTHDRWLVSYADFITLLFAFFVVLYAFAKADEKEASGDSRLQLTGHFVRSEFFPTDPRTRGRRLTILLSKINQSRC